MRPAVQAKNGGLAERLMRLRLAAASIYDAGVAKGLPPEELQNLIKPLTERLGIEIQVAAKEDLAGISLAGSMLEAQTEGYKESIKYLLQKIADNEYHQGLLEQAVMARMGAEGVREIHQHGYSAIITGDGDKATIKFR